MIGDNCDSITMFDVLLYNMIPKTSRNKFKNKEDIIVGWEQIPLVDEKFNNYWVKIL